MSSHPSSSSSSRKPQTSSTISQSSIFDLKSILSEHKDKFAKEGKGSVRGGSGREERRRSELSRDKFSRPSPNLSTRLARQTTSVSTERLSRPSEEQRLALMQKKADLYDKLQRGELEGIGEREMGEWVVDFESKWNERDSDGFSNHSSDVDESVSVPHPNPVGGGRGNSSGRDNGWEGMKPRNGKGKEKEKDTKKPKTEEDFEDFEDNYVQVEYIDELGRTRTGTRKEAKEAEREKERLREKGDGGAAAGEVNRDQMGEGREHIGMAHQEVLESNVIYGAQSLFPVYEPTQEDLIARLKAQDSGPLETHYDASREVRARAAGAYQFSLDEEERKKQMEELKKERAETELKRERGEGKINKVEEGRKRKLEERRALIEAKRMKMMGGKEGLAKARQDLKEKEADSFLEGLEKELKIKTEQATSFSSK